MRAVWGERVRTGHIVFTARDPTLRRQLETDPPIRRILVTETRVGYRLRGVTKARDRGPPRTGIHQMSDRPEADQRPSPEALLRQLRVRDARPAQDFLGAAPGVGKTYEMLQTAQAKRREGVDVVVGVVETHGRKETEALLEGLEIIPRRRVEYKGTGSMRWTSTRSSTRRPQLVLVDELRTPMRPAAGIRNATWMSRNCSAPASMSMRR